METIFSRYLPFLIEILECMGVVVITIGAFKAFYHYVRGLFTKDTYNLKYNFANSMATGLEFKLAGEILKTLLIHTLSELAIVGSIIILRAFLTFIIQKEMNHVKEEND